jgi:V/A-type H+-transporting ATPase subunit I
LFFALLIGDAGYGLIFLTGTYLIRKKAPNSPPEPFILMYVLAFATIIWGAVSGTWFGAEKIAQLPIFKTIVIERVNSFIDINQSFMMYICFLIGAVHLTVAYGTIALRVINSLKALAQLGWILIIWSMFFVAGKLVLGKNLPGCAAVIFPLGVTLILLFSYPQRNMLRGIGVALGDLPLRVISSFSDVISYLRLFAVGYATVAVASSFNDMALRIGFNNILGGSISAIILFLGHGLNIILGLLAVIVHGIRLNMLEFSSHLGMQWSGIEYNPFKE